MQFLVRSALAVLLATALDLVLAAVSGYALRTDALLLVLADAALLAVVVVPVMVALAATGVLRRAPRAGVLVAAAAPVLLAPLWRGEGGPPLLVAIVAATVLALLVLVEARVARGAAPAQRTGGVAAAAAVAAIVLAVQLPLPGRAMLGPPPTGRGEPATPERPNLVVVVLDTLRFDHVGSYGSARPTPWLDRFAARATVFTHALSSSSWTLPAHATLFTGLFPRAHGADLIEGDGGTSLAALGRLEDIARARPLSRDAVTLAELAERAGLETGAVCANTAYLYRHYGLDQGFRTYVDAPGSRTAARPAGLSLGVAWGMRRFRRAAPAPASVAQTGGGAPAGPDIGPRPRPRGLAALGRRLVESTERYYLLADEVNALALRWLEPRRDRRFFLFLNYMDAHEPYLPIGEYRRLYPEAATPQAVNLWAIRERYRGILPEERAPLVDAYDAEIRYLDDRLAALFARLEVWGLDDRTVVVIVADHGESFGEHHEMGHGNGVYETEARVPLLLRLPGQTEGRRVDRVVHLVDVLPTLVDLLGLERPLVVHGASLLGDGTRPLPPVVYTGRYHDLVRDHPRFYDRTHSAVYRDPLKLIARSDGSVELYDVRADPLETRDLAAERPAAVAALRSELAAFEAAVRPLYGTDGGGAASPEALERLRALGYVH